MISSLAFTAMMGCGDGGVDPLPDSGVEPDAINIDAEQPPTLLELYQAAVADAEIAEEHEIVDTLIAIREDNGALVRDGEGRVLMVTWTSYGGYDDSVGEDVELTREVWTTVAPSLQEFCRTSGLQGGELDLRLEQLLGLPPDNGKDRVVQFWVTPDDLFRPSPDREIDDSVAELDFPDGTPEAYITWFNELKATSYGPDGYPWTRLGYTYDWNPDTTAVGLSEFVISAESTVVVESVTSTDEYCQTDE